jgi:hypothetical protein
VHPVTLDPSHLQQLYQQMYVLVPIHYSLQQLVGHKGIKGTSRPRKSELLLHRWISELIINCMLLLMVNTGVSIALNGDLMSISMMMS